MSDRRSIGIYSTGRQSPRIILFLDEMVKNHFIVELTSYAAKGGKKCIDFVFLRHMPLAVRKRPNKTVLNRFIKNQYKKPHLPSWQVRFSLQVSCLHCVLYPPPQSRNRVGGVSDPALHWLSDDAKSTCLAAGAFFMYGIIRQSPWGSGTASARNRGTYPPDSSRPSSPAFLRTWWGQRSRQPGRRGGGPRSCRAGPDRWHR